MTRRTLAQPDPDYDGADGILCRPGGPQHPDTVGPYCAPLRCYCPGRRMSRDVARTVDGEPLFLPAVGAAPAVSTPPPAPHPAATPAAVTRPRADVGLDAPAESVKAADGARLRSSTLRAQVLALVAVAGPYGATSDDVERLTGRAHQSISATLHGLERDALAVRSGPVRPTRYGNDARAYLVTQHGLEELRRAKVPRPAAWTP